MVFEVEVGYCVGYPIRPDHRFTWVQVAAETGTEAQLVACQMTMSRGNYATSSRVLSVEA